MGRSGKGQETLREVQDWSGEPWRGLVRVVGPKGRIGTGR